MPAMTSKNKAYSAGARYEREAFRKYLERKVKAYGRHSSYGTILLWVRTRMTRYRARKGGL